MAIMGKRSAWAAQSKFPASTMAPPIEVPWPPMYLVVECTTTSAPCSIGRHRYGVATVLSMDPQILALDEPSAGLDPAARHNLIAVLRSLPQTMLIASHDLDFARALCTRAVVLREGRLAADVPIEALTEDLLADG